jgi:hypothetical protein
MPKHRQVQITVSERGLEEIVVTATGPREAGVQFLGRLLPGIELLERCSLTASDACVKEAARGR